MVVMGVVRPHLPFSLCFTAFCCHAQCIAAATVCDTDQLAFVCRVKGSAHAFVAHGWLPCTPSSFVSCMPIPCSHLYKALECSHLVTCVLLAVPMRFLSCCGCQGEFSLLFDCWHCPTDRLEMCCTSRPPVTRTTLRTGKPVSSCSLCSLSYGTESVV